jgi:hypothetical protein
MDGMVGFLLYRRGGRLSLQELESEIVWLQRQLLHVRDGKPVEATEGGEEPVWRTASARHDEEVERLQEANSALQRLVHRVCCSSHSSRICIQLIFHPTDLPFHPTLCPSSRFNDVHILCCVQVLGLRQYVPTAVENAMATGDGAAADVAFETSRILQEVLGVAWSCSNVEFGAPASTLSAGDDTAAALAAVDDVARLLQHLLAEERQSSEALALARHKIALMEQEIIIKRCVPLLLCCSAVQCRVCHAVAARVESIRFDAMLCTCFGGVLRADGTPPPRSPRRAETSSKRAVIVTAMPRRRPWRPPHRPPTWT